MKITVLLSLFTACAVAAPTTLIVSGNQPGTLNTGTRTILGGNEQLTTLNTGTRTILAGNDPLTTLNTGTRTILGGNDAITLSTGARTVGVDPILNKVQQASEDGSYMFGYENLDGSFRMENRDASGLVQGKYGYIDANGQRQEFEYTAGSIGGTSLGFRSQDALVPNVVGATLPVVRSSAQRAQDFQFSSVDDDRDGIPDNRASVGIADNNVRLISTQGNQGLIQQVVSPQSVVSVVGTPQTVGDTVVVESARVVDTPQTMVAPTVIRTDSGLINNNLGSFIQTGINRQVGFPTSSVIGSNIVFQEQQPTTVIRTVPNNGGFVTVGGQLENFMRGIVQPVNTNVIRNVDPLFGQQQQVQLIQGFDTRGFTNGALY